MKAYIFVIAVVLQLFQLLDLAKGHGMMLDPAGRGSRWHFDKTAIENYNDMSNYCGGFSIMYNNHSGSCGLCGDNYGDSTPRAHELGGQYGQGVIVKKYAKGSSHEIVFNITASHGGYVYFEVCNLDKSKGVESEDCFGQTRLNFRDGSDKYPIHAVGEHKPIVIMPNHFTCDHCVLRWIYVAGNNMNICDDGIERMGCGPQETFKNCGDISITV